MYKSLFSAMVFLVTLTSCKKDETTNVNTTQIVSGIIPTGMENKIIFGTDTTNFTHGFIYPDNSDTSFTVNLYFIDKTTKDTLNLYMSKFKGGSSTKINDGTYNINENSDLMHIMGGDWDHGEFKALSGSVIIKSENGIYSIAMSMEPDTTFGSKFGLNKLIGYYRGTLTIE